MERPPRPRSTISQEIRRLKKRDGTTVPTSSRRKSAGARIAGLRTEKAGSPAEGAWLTDAGKTMDSQAALELIENWFESQGWKPFDYQKDAWLARLENQSGLIHVPTGAGKTYAAFMGALAYAIADTYEKRRTGLNPRPGVRILYVTPLKAVSRDIRKALERPIRELDLPFRVEDRTGDTSANVRAKQKLAMPEVLVTTPESLSLLLSHGSHAEMLGSLQSVILDEWHECLGTKRGSLLELSLARLRAINPNLSTWALTATLSNIPEAAQAATGDTNAHVVQAKVHRPVEIETLLPLTVDAFPWAGQLGMRMTKLLVGRLDAELSTLIFTNTRSQAERWYQALLSEKPEWADIMALHHGSLEADERARVEAGLKDGTLRIVVCTSTLDLGVDFGPVERVVQIGSPKGIARLLQRAGRSAHRPGQTAKILFVPTQAFELVEVEAIRKAIQQGVVEERNPIYKPIDVLTQHLVTRALGGGFTQAQIADEIRSAYSFRDLSDQELNWALAFICDGGPSLQAYPSYRKVVYDGDLFRVLDGRIARIHRMNIGTIESNAVVRLKFMRGREIGQVEVNFVSKLKRGDRFLFGGRTLEFIQMKDFDAIVRNSKGAATTSPSWSGGRLPYSRPLSGFVRSTLEEFAANEIDAPISRALAPIIEAQKTLSQIPKENEALIELTETRDGSHLFLYTFEGRNLHEALGALLAFRFAKRKRATFSVSSNDYGVELVSAGAFPYADVLNQEIFSPDNLEDDLEEALNLSQLARSTFREIARVAGLVHPGHPGARKSARQLQASAGLLFDVLVRYEPDHPLIQQAEQQALGDQLESGRLRDVLTRLSEGKRVIRTVTRPTPLGFPLYIERTGARLSTESLVDRIERMKAQWVQV